MKSKRLLVWVLLGIVSAVSGSLRADDRVQYNRDVRPILAENCFACHGPDSASRAADLRLDRRDPAIKAGAFVPGKPDESGLVERIVATDADEVMPPPKTHKTLTDPQKATLKRWIAEGAEYQPHWSLLAPQRPPLPAVKNAAWCRNPIDHFVLADLEQMGLQPAAEADRRTLARRLSLDVVGLPPAAEEVDAFVADTSADAYEKYLDRLMASTHWGEHRGRFWLDAARYADTHGLHFDNFREMWSYRDWVIEAYNRNMPFDRFTVEQLAGDLLPEPTMEQRIATGFTRCQITTNEGGTIPEENLVLYTRDRTETVSKVWLGLTANCAVCHEHKFDPISQREFYQMSAFFNNTTQGAMDGNIKDTPPIVVVPKPDDRPRWDALPKELAEARKQTEDRKTAARPEFDRWLAEATPEKLAGMLPAGPLAFHAPLAEACGTAIKTQLGDQACEIALKSEPAREPGQVGEKALKIDAEHIVQVPSAGDFEKDQAFSFGAWVKLPAKTPNGAIFARMDDKNAFRGWDFWVEGMRIGSHIISHWDDDALKVVSNNPLPADKWNHVLVTYDGSAKAAGVKIYVNGQVQPSRPAADKLKGSIRTEVPLSIGQRNTSSRVDGALVQDVRIYARALSPEEVQKLATGTRSVWLASKPADQRTDADKNELFPTWLNSSDQPYQQLAARVSALEKEQSEIQARGTVAYVMQERPAPAKAFVLNRGEYDQRRDEVEPATFSCLPAMAADLPRNRLGFARWLLTPEHPLASRVTVNRFWQEVFGQGIVRTTGDFGVSGEMPSNQAMLDWLSVEFRESGWDIKKFFRLMLTSAAYRQSAQTTPEKLEKDPQNRYLSRGPRFRLDAELIRDYALSASGLLIDKIGGPSVKPYQPPGVWESVAMIGSNTRDYRQDNGENLYRRSMYTFWKRAAPPASMDVLNAPSREVCTVRRERTNTPLQALVTLNDPQFIEAARNLAQRTILEGGSTPESRLEFLARRLLARTLAAEETAVVQSSLDRLLAYYQGHPDDAKLLVAVGESKANPSVDPSLLAGWTMLANQLLNLDEVLCK